jgi:hypothetical protein
LNGSSVLRDLVELHEIIGCSLDYFEFSGLERLENIPLKIRVDGLNLKKECKLSFDIAPEYINNFLYDIPTNRRFYKDEGYYNNKRFISTLLSSEFLIITDYKIKLSEDGIPDEFVDELSDFILDDDIFVLQIDTELNRNNAAEEIDCHYFNGMKIYKIPTGPANWDSILKKIENKLMRLCSKGNFLSKEETKFKINNYRYFASYNMSFEISPDNYLEIYATKEALELFFLPCKKNGLESLGVVYPMANLKLVNIVDHYKDLYQTLFEVTIYKHFFGSKNNNFYSDNLIFDYEE